MSEQIEIDVPDVAEDGSILYELDLRSLPAGYGLGEYRGGLAVVENCPACGKGGLRVLSRMVAHAIVLRVRSGSLTFDREASACKVPPRPKTVDCQEELELG